MITKQYFKSLAYLIKSILFRLLITLPGLLVLFPVIILIDLFGSDKDKEEIEKLLKILKNRS